MIVVRSNRAGLITTRANRPKPPDPAWRIRVGHSLVRPSGAGHRVPLSTDLHGTIVTPSDVERLHGGMTRHP